MLSRSLNNVNLLEFSNKLDISSLNRELDTLQDGSNPEKIKELQVMHKKAMEIISHHQKQEDIILECIIKILEPLFNDKIDLKKINFFFAVIQELKRFDDTVIADLLDWILSDENRLLKGDILIKMIRDSLVQISQLDFKLSESLENNKNNAAIFLSVARIIKTFCIDEKTSNIDFAKCTDLIINNIANLKAQKDVNEKMIKYLEDFRSVIKDGIVPPQVVAPSVKVSLPNSDLLYKSTLQRALSYFSEPSQIYDHACQSFEEWLSIDVEENMPIFIKSLETSIFNNDENMIRFFTYLADICVEQTAITTKGHLKSLSYTYVDALTKLIIVIIKGYEGEKTQIFDKILLGIFTSLTKNHETKRADFQ